MQELICFSAFLYQYIEFFVFLKFSRRGGYSPSSPPPPKSATVHVFCLFMVAFRTLDFIASLTISTTLCAIIIKLLSGDLVVIAVNTKT